MRSKAVTIGILFLVSAAIVAAVAVYRSRSYDSIEVGLKTVSSEETIDISLSQINQDEVRLTVENPEDGYVFAISANVSWMSIDFKDAESGGWRSVTGSDTLKPAAASWENTIFLPPGTSASFTLPLLYLPDKWRGHKGLYRIHVYPEATWRPPDKFIEKLLHDSNGTSEVFEFTFK